MVRVGNARHYARVLRKDARLWREPVGYCADTDEQVYLAIRAGVSMITGNNPEPALRILRQQGLHK